MKHHFKILPILIALAFLSVIDWGYFSEIMSLTMDAAMEFVQGGNAAASRLEKEFDSLSVDKFIKIDIEEMKKALDKETETEDNVRQEETTEAVFEEEGTTGAEESTRKTINGFDTTVNPGKQGKHIVGNKNYIVGRSIFQGTIEDAQNLINEFAGTGEWIGTNKERIDFGKIIGQYVNPSTGETTDTSIGIIHYSKTGTHIVPAKPIS